MNTIEQQAYEDELATGEDTHEMFFEGRYSRPKPKPTAPVDPRHRAKLDWARTEIMKSPQFAVITSLLLSRDDVMDDQMLSNGQPTAGTNGVEHHWHPAFVESQPKDEIRKTKLHELGHDFLFHSDGRFKRMIEWGKSKGLDEKSAEQLALHMGHFKEMMEHSLMQVVDLNIHY